MKKLLILIISLLLLQLSVFGLNTIQQKATKQLEVTKQTAQYKPSQEVILDLKEDILILPEAISNSDQLLETCDDGIQNGDETGIDCGGSCEPCPCNGNIIRLDIDVKNFLIETSWNITDENGTTVASNDNTQPANSIVTEDICLAGGCYTFTSIGDGSFAGLYYGSYSVTDHNGDTLVLGANLSVTIVTEFCVPSPTCNDDIQNGDETGIDCGGSCADCVVLTSLSDEASSPENPTFRISPNPVTDFIDVSFKDIREDGIIEIITACGKTIWQQPTETEATGIRIPVSTLPGGVYYIRLSFGSSTHATKRFLKLK